MFEGLIIIRGGGDLGSGTALRLWRAGFRVAIVEAPHPIAVRRTVALCEAVYDGMAHVEEAIGKLVPIDHIDDFLAGSPIPVVVDPELRCLERVRPQVIVDAILAKRNTGTSITMAPFVVALGPGFRAGDDVHAVIETNRGANLGRVIWNGAAEANTGEPGTVAGRATSRVVRAPASGALRTIGSIGAIVDEGEIVARVNGHVVRAAFRALVRGLARDGLEVVEGMKIGDLDPRLDANLVLRVSDKSLAVAGGVLEAVLMNCRGERA